MGEYPTKTPSILAAETMDMASRRSYRRQLYATHRLREAMKSVFEGENPNLKIEFGNEAVIPGPYIPDETEQNKPDEPGKIRGRAEQIAKIKITLPNGAEVYFAQVNKYVHNPEQVNSMNKLSPEEKTALLAREGGYKMLPYGGSINPTRNSIRKWYNLAQRFPDGTVLNVGITSPDPNPNIAFKGELTTISCARGNLKQVLEVLESNGVEVSKEAKSKFNIDILSEQERVTFEIKD